MKFAREFVFVKELSKSESTQKAEMVSIRASVGSVAYALFECFIA